MRPGPVRIVAWGLISSAAGALGLVLTESVVWADAAIGLAVGGALAVGLAVEGALLIVGQIQELRAGPARPGAARPADGVVHTWAMTGVKTFPPGEATPWKRFEILAPARSGSAESSGSDRWRASRNRPLLGHVALISVFVGRDGRSWTGEEIRAAHRSLETAGRWIEREAIRRKAPINVGLADTFFQVEDDDHREITIEFVPEGDDFGPMEADATTKAVAGASRVAATLGFADVADLIMQINATIPADAHVWLWHLKQRGRSHAIPVGDRVVRGVGLAICYARESSFPEPLAGPGRVDPVTVAHELMHLFGASDKYGIPIDRFRPGDVPHRDIMRLDEDRLDRLTIGKLTAREVGWGRA